MRAASLTLVLSLAFAASAAAQRAPQRATERGYVTFNVGIQPAPADVSDTFTFDLYAETASIDVQYPGKEGLVIDGGVGLPLWKRLGAGVAVSYRASDGGMTATGSLPHPFFLDRMRTFEGETSGLERTEVGVHIQALYFVPVAPRWRVILSAGPSYFSLDQGLAGEVRYNDEFPFDTVTFRDVVERTVTATGIGFNAGADVTFLFGRRFGVGALVRYAGAALDLDAPGKDRIDVDAGGLQAGAGVRILF